MSWTPPPELRSSPPRQVRLTTIGMLVGVIEVGVLLAGIGLGWKMVNETSEQTKISETLAAQGADIEATVTRLWRGGGKSKPHRVSYRFETGGRILHGDAQISREKWEGLSEGSHLTVRYAPADPMMNRPADQGRGPKPLWVAYAVPGIFAAGAIGMWWMVRKQRRLLEDGRVAPAVITKVSYAKNGKVVRYESVLPGGSKQTGRGVAKRRDVEVGGEVTVVYDPENPKMSAPYPLELVKVAE